MTRSASRSSLTIVDWITSLPWRFAVSTVKPASTAAGVMRLRRTSVKNPSGRSLTRSVNGMITNAFTVDFFDGSPTTTVVGLVGLGPLPLLGAPAVMPRYSQFSLKTRENSSWNSGASLNSRSRVFPRYFISGRLLPL